MTQEVKVMVGIYASGKSTWIQQEMAKLEEEHKTTCVISYDYVRQSLFQNRESYFDCEEEIFNEFVWQIDEAMALGIDVVFVDATNINSISRNEILGRLMPDKRTNLTFEVMKTPVSVCLTRNSQRTDSEKVSNSAIQKMARSFNIPTEKEFPKNKWGFKNIKVNIHEENIYHR